ncbi:pentapeptide repeat-containing protein [Lacrimispora indolis]|uniref:pentapeptide repeat-containing protein n=1 Tax=Lacrimispora indolis TaxID=69825 RepID=UPI00041E9AA2|nr:MULTISPECIES: pentapeptide repeat-containing protein [Lachnospiraceae]MBE7719993.1 pentapeptide repeat-containing protein [Lacrimispora celerecrescens]
MGQKLLTPILPETMDFVLEDMEELSRRKDQEEAVTDVLIRNLHIAEEDLSRMRFSAVIFENCIFQDCTFEKGEFTDVVFRACDISNCNFEDSYFNRTEFLSSKGLGVKFCGNTMLHTVILDCNFNYGNFDSSRLEHIRFSDTQIRGGFLTQCRCKAVEWNRANLENASFFKTVMRGMDFTSSMIQGLVLSDGCPEIKGAVVDLYQAAELAKYLGVVIKS